MIEFKYEKDLGMGCIDTKIIYQVHGDCSLPELLQEFRKFLLAIGYHPDEYIEAE